MFKKVFILAVLLFWPVTAFAGPDKDAEKHVVLETSMGTIKIELFDDKAPITVKNFRNYVREKFYDGLIFHRVIPGFVVQAGGFMPGMKVRRPTHPAITNEADNGLNNKRGTLSMARTSQINSATSQFFINLRDNTNLDHHGRSAGRFGYAVFGKVVEGMDVVDKIAAAPTASKGLFKDVPRQDVVIVKAYEQ